MIKTHNFFCITNYKRNLKQFFRLIANVYQNKVDKIILCVPPKSKMFLFNFLILIIILKRKQIFCLISVNFLLKGYVLKKFDWIVTFANNLNFNLIIYADNLYSNLINYCAVPRFNLIPFERYGRQTNLAKLWARCCICLHRSAIIYR